MKRGCRLLLLFVGAGLLYLPSMKLLSQLQLQLDLDGGALWSPAGAANGHSPPPVITLLGDDDEEASHDDRRGLHEELQAFLRHHRIEYLLASLKELGAVNSTDLRSLDDADLRRLNLEAGLGGASHGVGATLGHRLG